MSNCLFCNMARGDVPNIRVYEDDSVFAIMDIFPESQGHVLIIPKQHADDLLDVDAKTLAHVAQVSKKIATAAKTALSADGIRIHQFSGAAAGQTVFHYHMHVVPAYEGVAFGHHASKPADSAVLQQTADKIRAALDNTH